ncbi:hypothetical protein [Streptomyces griseocarneus]|uniref:hypothetical protein n=1 Tax=Streptomyces griseocarneus TaxID=51201 RepID=UPI00167CD551|nr:hypothetical protein [Streptomyces griseocarneus]MBZ6475013.1 hypothetical protein [Streptomyces griseocarneus]GHG62769.1 hypothetical protein GCM10018779_31790 [Streptomyces griseocarneus]
MFELLPRIGIVLPDSAGTLRFGMDEDAAQATLARLGQVRGDDVPGAPWALTVACGDLELTAGPDAIARSGPQQTDPLLTNVVLRRTGHTRRPHPRLPMAGHDTRPPVCWGPAAVPVVLDDIDLFGYPATEVLEALGDDRDSGLRLRPVVPGGYAHEVTFRRERLPRGGDRTGTDEPVLADYEHMWTTGRNAWQLERTGTGYLIVLKGDQPMDMLICHDTLADQIIARMIAAGVEIVAG